MAADWERLSQQDNIYLNGKSLSSYRAQYNNFATEQNVIAFFEHEFYDQLALPETQKPQVLTYLQDYFHQQGFMFPVSNTIAYTLMEAGKTQNEDSFGLTITTNDYSEQHINITVNPEGISLQELVEVASLTYSKGKASAKLPPDNPGENPYVIKAEGTLHFDFRDPSADPIVTVKSNKISLGRDDIKPLLSPSDFLAKLWDFIAKICGFNKVELDEGSSFHP